MRQEPRRARSRRAGFTLLEMVVVVAIVGLGWFTLVPRLDLTGPAHGTFGTNLAAFMDEIRLKAEQTGRVQHVQLAPGNEKLAWNERTFELPSPVARTSINGRWAPGLSYRFSVYPTGLIDQVDIRLSSGQALVGDPLMGTLDVRSVAEAP